MCQAPWQLLCVLPRVFPTKTQGGRQLPLDSLVATSCVDKKGISWRM